MKTIKSLEGSGISYVLQYRSDLSCIIFQSKMKSDIVYQRSDSLTAVCISIKTITFSLD